MMPVTLTRIASFVTMVLGLANAQEPRGGAWSNDGTILFAPLLEGPLRRIPASGGDSVEITQLQTAERSHRFPSFLPDGRHFIYFATGGGAALWQAWRVLEHWTSCSRSVCSILTPCRCSLRPDTCSFYGSKRYSRDGSMSERWR